MPSVIWLHHEIQCICNIAAEWSSASSVPFWFVIYWKNISKQQFSLDASSCYYDSEDIHVCLPCVAWTFIFIIGYKQPESRSGTKSKNLLTSNLWNSNSSWILGEYLWAVTLSKCSQKFTPNVKRHFHTNPHVKSRSFLYMGDSKYYEHVPLKLTKLTPPNQ